MPRFSRVAVLFNPNPDTLLQVACARQWDTPEEPHVCLLCPACCRIRMLGPWAAADASTTCAWKILLKSSCPQGRGALPARDSGWIQTLLASGPTSQPCPSLTKPRRALHKPGRALHKPRRPWIWFWIPLPILSVLFSEICATCWSFSESHVCLCPRFFQLHSDSATQWQSQQHAIRRGACFARRTSRWCQQFFAVIWALSDSRCGQCLSFDLCYA